MTSNTNQETPDTTKPAPTEDKVYGLPRAEFNKLSLREQKLKEMADTDSPLRNQEGVENIVDYQLLSSTPAIMIQAMSGWDLLKLAKRAAELETTLKGSQAGTLNP